MSFKKALTYAALALCFTASAALARAGDIPAPVAPEDGPALTTSYFTWKSRDTKTQQGCMLHAQAAAKKAHMTDVVVVGESVSGFVGRVTVAVRCVMENQDLGNAQIVFFTASGSDEAATSATIDLIMKAWN